MVRDIDAEDEDTSAPEGGVRERLKPVVHYAILGFAPVVSIVALGVALFAGGNHPDPTQISELNSRIEGLNASLSATREELENLKFSMSREKNQRAEDRKKADDRDAVIIRNVTRVQEKLKIAPTLEEQLRVAAREDAAAVRDAGAASAPAAVSAAVSAPAAVGKTQAASAPASAVTKPAAAKPAPKAGEKMSPQVKAIKDAIEKYNKE